KPLVSITLKLPDACDIFQNGYQNAYNDASCIFSLFTNLKIFTVYAMSTQHLRNAVWRYASTSEFPRFSRKDVDSHVDAELNSCQRKG
ncbi:uncharacterized protein Bfra_000442, partial [Botrytis fragariae]